MRLGNRRTILTYHTRKELERRIYDPALNAQAADFMEGGCVHAPNPLISQAQADARTKQLKKALDEGSPQDESPQYKRWRDRRIKALEEDLRRDTIPHEVFHMKRADKKDYHKVTNELVRQMGDPQRREKEDELKSLLRERDPENPNAGKLTFLREDRRVQA